MSGIPFLIQVLLLALWYTVPAMASTPLWVILLPTLIPLAVLACILVMLAVVTVLGVILGR